MNVGTLVRVKTKLWREGDVGVIVRMHPPDGIYDKRFSVLFWDETIDTVSAVCLEEII